MILTKMKQTAEDFLGEKVQDAVITVPAYFKTRSARRRRMRAHCGAQRAAHHQRADGGGLAYGLDKKKDEKIAVFDLAAERSTFHSGTGDGVFEVKSTKATPTGRRGLRPARHGLSGE